MPRLLTALCLFASLAATSLGADRPNIILIMVDDLGKDWIRCYGADQSETPHIDALAAGGIRFNNAWSMPQCTPTRVALLTGQYPYRTGWVNHWDVPRWGVGYFDWREYTTFASVLRDAGYRTAIAGKWQINDFRVEPKALEKHGFEDWCVWTGYEAGNPPSGKRYWDAYIHTRSGSRTYSQEFGPDIYCSFLLDFMRKHRKEPMLLYFPMALTHGPLVTSPLSQDAEDKLSKLQGMVRYTDHLVGLITKEVQQLGLEDNTIIIFTTDNGTSKGMLGTIQGRRLRGGKGTLNESGVAAPFIVYGPGHIPRGKVSNALTDFTDLLPTFAELAFAELPQDRQLDGKSLAAVWQGQSTAGPREWILAMGYGPARRDQGGFRGREDFTWRAIRNERYKAWVDPHRQIARLFDLQQDPSEQQNLVDSSDPDARRGMNQFRELVAAMPPRDARPRFRPRGKLPWDRPLRSQ